MVPKTGHRVPKLQISLSESEFSQAVGAALQLELGASHRAAKTVMAWTGVSDRTARRWLHGSTSPSGLHLVVLAAHCHPVLATFLRLTGHESVALSVDLEALESRLEAILESTRQLRCHGS